MKKYQKLLAASALSLAILPLSFASYASVCVRNDAGVILKVCEEGKNCKSGILKGQMVDFPKAAGKDLSVYYMDATFTYRLWRHQNLNDGESYVVEGTLGNLSGKIVKGACPKDISR